MRTPASVWVITHLYTAEAQSTPSFSVVSAESGCCSGQRIKRIKRMKPIYRVNQIHRLTFLRALCVSVVSSYRKPGQRIKRIKPGQRIKRIKPIRWVNRISRLTSLCALCASVVSSYLCSTPTSGLGFRVQAFRSGTTANLKPETLIPTSAHPCARHRSALRPGCTRKRTSPPARKAPGHGKPPPTEIEKRTSRRR